MFERTPAARRRKHAVPLLLLTLAASHAAANAAAASVRTGDHLRRSGATSIPEAPRLMTSCSDLEPDVHHPVNFGSVSERTEARSPRHDIRLQTQTNLSERRSRDAVVRFADQLRSTPRTTPCRTADLRLGWRARRDVEPTLVARDIFDVRPLELHSAVFFHAADQRRSGLTRVVWTF